jgi:hypothetical protein
MCERRHLSLIRYIPSYLPDMEPQAVETELTRINKALVARLCEVDICIEESTTEVL